MTPFPPLPPDTPLAGYQRLAADLGGDDARPAVARGYGFRDWAALETLVAAVATDPAVRRFELAAEAVIDGDLATLDRLLAEDPALPRARSNRITGQDPPVHRATLLHYLAANGVEGYRQRSPANAVAIGRRLLEAGAEPDALASMYGGEYATMSMLVSSSPPAGAGVQIPLVHLLADFGADVNGTGSAQWGSNVRTALAFGFLETARALVGRGAAADRLPLAAGLGGEDDVRRMLPDAPAAERHAALALAAQHGHAGIVLLLLRAGEDPNRFNPDGLHSHSTPLHQAALAGHLEVIRTLLAHGARADLTDAVWQGTALDWARHGGRTDAADLLSGGGTGGRTTNPGS